MPRRSDSRPRRRAVPIRPSPAFPDAQVEMTNDRFFHHLVRSMRNAVIAVHLDGTLALVNDEAYRIFSMTPQPTDIGRPFNQVFRDRPDAIKAFSGAFDMLTLPNRAEMRLKDVDRVIGYTLSQVRDDEGQTIG